MERECEILSDEHGGALRVHLQGSALLRCPLLNKGTAFTDEERTAFALHGLLPPVINTLEEQVARAYRAFAELPTPIAKYAFLRALQDRQEVVFFALLEAHITEMLPIVYTPTVGEAVERYSAMYEEPRGLLVSTATIARARALVESHPADDVRMIVATDSSAILGIGDQGHGGVAIAIGKLALYTAGGGVSPFQSVPVGLDVGTERKDLLADPMYLGVRHARLRGEKYFAFLDAFVDAVRARWPRAVIQWEDFSKDAAFAVLERYRETIPSFNDDIQGTGAVALAGLLNACRLRGEALRDQRVVVHGAGAGGVGVATAIQRGMMREGLSLEAAAERIFITDSKGLVTRDRDVEAYKRGFAQPSGRIPATPGRAPTLFETIRGARATVLLGLSGQPGSFDEASIRAMADNCERPVICPLSNPTSSVEATPEQLLAWTSGRAIVSTGSPFDPVLVAGKPVEIGQGNNAFIFPGLGQGAILAEARVITDGMVIEAAYALAEYTAERHPDRVYPPVAELREVSERVAARVVARAIEDGVARLDGASAQRAARSATEARSPQAMLALVRERSWRPRYLPYVATAKT
jgi:malate dehydrogenase (oxaloacetate-decarboxylating)